MPETVRLSSELGIIEVRSFDDVSLADVDSSLTEVERIRKETGVDRVLVDVRKQTSMPEMSGTFQIASSLPDSLRIALLFSEGQSTEEDIRFVESIAGNGGVTIQAFPSEDEALQWLAQG